MSCSCGSIGRTDGIRMCQEHHRYWHNDREFDSVSRVIRATMQEPYEEVHPIVLANANWRGTCIDGYFSDWIKNPNGMMTPLEFREMIEPHFQYEDPKEIRYPHTKEQHAEDCRIRLERLLEWWTKTGRKGETQKIVYDEVRAVAGTADIRTDGCIYDIKCVSSLQPSYRVQLGAYALCDLADEVGIIHVMKDRIRYKAYPVTECVTEWMHCWNWYDTKRRLTA